MALGSDTGGSQHLVHGHKFFPRFPLLFATRYFGGIDFFLKHANAGSLEIETGPVSTSINVADIGVEPVRFEGGGLERAIEVQRLPEQMTLAHVSHSVQAKVRSRGDTRLFVRVTQEDGHRAWSSPVYLFRQ